MMKECYRFHLFTGDKKKPKPLRVAVQWYAQLLKIAKQNSLAVRLQA